MKNYDSVKKIFEDNLFEINLSQEKNKENTFVNIRIPEGFLSVNSIPENKINLLLFLNDFLFDKSKNNKNIMENIIFITESISPDTDLNKTIILTLKKLKSIFGFESVYFFQNQQMNIFSADEFINMNYVSFINTYISIENPQNIPIAHSFEEENSPVKNFIIIPINFYNENAFGHIVLFNKNNRLINLEDYYFSYLAGEIIESIFEVSYKEYQLNMILSGTLKSLLKTLSLRTKKDFKEFTKLRDLTEKFSNKLNLSSKEINSLLLSTYIYDIGMISIPDYIFSKTEELNENEKKLIKNHTVLGYNLISKMKNIDDSVKDIVLNHHERYDGSGYPKGLKGNEIPYLSQIIGLCDFYISMSQKRAYRPAYDKEYILSELEKNKNILFDGNLIKILLEVI
ncbi:MAG: HD domain-containing protein [Thermotogae bacterium]|nr:HD domain-containing protein [Thermotogota bacterium]HOO75650.1 HD domain-containing phosphohydrolase [Tepiditoga sp.]